MFKKNSILLGWGATYLALLIIPLIISLSCMTEIEGALRKEIVRSNEAVLEQMQKECDQFLYSLNDMYSLLFLDTDIKNLANIDPYSQRGAEILKNIKTKMSSQKSTLNIIEEAYVYYPGREFVVASQGLIDCKTAYSMWHSSEFEYGKWLEWLENINYRKYLITERTQQFEDEKEKVITLVGSAGNGEFRVVVFLDMAQLEAKLTEYSEINDGTVILADENNELILQCGINTDNSGENLLENKSGDFIISSRDSSVKKWKFYTVMEKNMYWATVKSARRLMYFTALACLLFGVIFVTFVLFRNYRPIKKIINIIDNNPDFAAKKNGNEYTFIVNKISEIISDRDSLSGQLEKSRNVLQNDAIQKLLNKRFYDAEEMETRLKNAKIYFESNLFAVALINVENFRNLFPEDGNMSMAERHELTVLIVSNIIKEKVEEYHQCFIAEQNDCVAVLISLLHEDKKASLGEILRALKDGVKAVEDNFNLFITAALSDIHEGISGISDCYVEASEVLNISELVGGENVMEYNSVKDDSDTSVYGYSAEYELSLIKYMNEGNKEGAAELLDKLFEEVMRRKSVSLYNIHLLAADMGHTFLKVNSDIGIAGLKNMLNAKTPKELYISAKECIFSICDKIIGENKIYALDLRERITGYILENYTDQSLCAQSIASHFGLSGAYLSEKFKSETGESLHHLISKVRVDKAKELMETSSLNLEKVAEQVGFCDTQALRRAFKRHEGVLPSNYRRK